jgi:drug/metabolite transporter (DMT)-like permease
MAPPGPDFKRFLVMTHRTRRARLAPARQSAYDSATPAATRVPMPDTPSPARPLVGVALVVTATLTFALADVIGKHLVTSLPVVLVAGVRYAIGLVLISALLGPRHGPGLWRTQRTGAVILRGAVLSLATLTMGLALRVMPLGETVSILYLSPFLVMVLSGPILGERVPPAAWIGAGLGFAGVLLIMRPGSGLDPVGVMWALVNAGLGTAYTLMTRGLNRTESVVSMLFWINVCGVVIFGLSCLALPAWPAVTAAQAGLMAVLGGLTLVGHFLFTTAYRHAPAALLAPVSYLHLVWAAGLGWAVFGHLPDAISLAGMAMICLAGAAVAARANRPAA